MFIPTAKPDKALIPGSHQTPDVIFSFEKNNCQKKTGISVKSIFEAGIRKNAIHLPAYGMDLRLITTCKTRGHVKKLTIKANNAAYTKEVAYSSIIDWRKYNVKLNSYQ